MKRYPALLVYLSLVRSDIGVTLVVSTSSIQDVEFIQCKNAEDGRSKCCVRPERDCVWVEIRKRADIDGLKQLEALHQELKKAEKDGKLDLVASPPILRSTTRSRIRNILGWFGARIQSIEKLFALFRSF